MAIDTTLQPENMGYLIDRKDNITPVHIKSLYEEKQAKRMLVQTLKQPIRTCFVFASNVFPSEKDAMQAIRQRHEEQRKAYKAELNSVRDLLKFAVHEQLIGLDCDTDAFDAFIERAAELGYPDLL